MGNLEDQNYRYPADGALADIKEDSEDDTQLPNNPVASVNGSPKLFSPWDKQHATSGFLVAGLTDDIVKKEEETGDEGERIEITLAYENGVLQEVSCISSKDTDRSISQTATVPMLNVKHPNEASDVGEGKGIGETDANQYIGYLNDHGTELAPHVRCKTHSKLPPPIRLDCAECGCKFDTKFLMERHMRSVHKVKRPYACDVCKYRFKTYHHLLRHKPIHLKPPPTPQDCPHCGDKFDSKIFLEYHLASFHNIEKPYVCDKCEFRTRHLQNLDRHKRTHTKRPSPMTHDCTTCGREFKSKMALERHMIGVHNIEKPYTCDECEFGTKHHFNLVRHKRTHIKFPTSVSSVHLSMSTGKEECRLCGGKFQKKILLASHLKSVHNVPKPYMCDICDYCGREKFHLERHMRIHKNDQTLSAKPESSKFLFCYYCHWCTKTRKEMKMHIRKNHQSHLCPVTEDCEMCGYKFQTRKLLAHHMRSIHSIEKLYAGDICGNRSKDKYHLGKHKRTHVGHQPQARPNHQPQARPNHQPQARPIHQLQARPNLQLQARPNLQLQARPNHQMQARPNHQPQARSNHQPQARPDHQPQARSNHQPQARPDHRSRVRAKRQPLPPVPESSTALFCYYCHWCTTGRGKLKRHIRKNHQSSPVTQDCTVCGYKFPTKKLLALHMRSIHNKEEANPNKMSKVFFCFHCHWRGRRRHEVVKHLKEKHCLVSWDRSSIKARYHCDVCDYSCTVAQLLKFHKRKHTGEKPFACDQCDYRSIYPCGLKKHKQYRHGERPFACDRCDYRAVNSQSLKVHKLIHNEIKPFACDLCEYRTRTNERLMQHQRIHTGEKPYACDMCDYRSARHAEMWQHKRVHRGYKPYVCDICGRRFLRKTQMQNHRRTHTGSKPFACSQCDYRATKSQSLIIHKRIHTGELKYACDQCNFKSRRSDVLFKHKERLHSNKIFACDSCDYLTKVKEYFRAHLKKHVGGYVSAAKHGSKYRTHEGIPAEKLHACDVCEYRGRYIADLKIHKLTHTGEKLNACDMCDYTSSRKQSLKAHIMRHTGETPYACDQCDFKTNSSSNFRAHEKLHKGKEAAPFVCDACDYRTFRPQRLVVHKRKHTGEKPYVCDVCGYRSAASQPMLLHKRTHTGEKPYACDWCDVKFSSTTAVLMHNKSKHPENMYACGTCSYQHTSKFKVEQHLNKCHPLKSLIEVEIPPVNQSSKAGVIRLLFNCSKCSFSDHSRCTVEEHMLDCHPEVPFEEYSILESSVWESE